MYTTSETVELFIAPVASSYKYIAAVQKVLLKAAAETQPTQALAATRLLGILFDSPISSLLLNIVPEFSSASLSDSEVVSPVQTIADSFSAYSGTLRNAVEESKLFLPESTVEILLENSVEGYPIENIAAGAFLVLTANMQD